MALMAVSGVLLLVGLVVLREDDYAFCLAILILVYLFSSWTPAKAEPPLLQCEHTLAACDKLVQAQDAQVKLLKAEVAAFQKEADGSHNAPITLYTALGGAAAGTVMGEVGGVARGGLIGAAMGAVAGAGVGLILGGLGL